MKKLNRKTKILGAGPRLRMWRKVNGIKLLPLGRLIKVSQGSLSDIENNKSNPSAVTITNLAIHTDINIFWMLTGKKGNIKEGEIP